MFELVGAEPAARGSPIIEGLVDEKDEFVSEVTSEELRDLDAIGVGTINERIEITLLDRLILLADDLDLPNNLIASLEENRSEARAALSEMQAILD